MPRIEFRKSSIAMLVLLVASALAWADQKKENPPPKQAPKASTHTNTSHPTTHPTPTHTNTERPNNNTGHPGNSGYRPEGNTGTRPTGNTGTRNEYGGTGGRPAGNTGYHPAGGPVHGPGGRLTTTHTMPGGRTASVTMHGNGRLATIHSGNMTINHGIHGGTMIRTEHPDGRMVVNDGRHGGFVQRPYFSRGGRTYYARTYVRDGHVYSRAYVGYNYRGFRYYGYVPDHFYHPVFYGWAYHPWMHPVYYGPAAWGWVGAPWYVRWHFWFTPYPVYASAGLWLTDYMIASNMQSAYQAGVEAGREQAYAQNAPPPPPPGPADNTQDTPLSPEVKQAIADEVQAQLAAERAAAATNGPQPTGPGPAPAPEPAPAPAPMPAPTSTPTGQQVPDALNPSERVFVVASNMDVTTAGNQECGLTGGDVLMRLTDTPDANQNVNASVQSSKKGDCAAGQTIVVGVNDLQEMHNHFHEQLDSGLNTLATNSGKNGLPTAPDTTTSPGQVPAPPPDSGAADQLQAQQQQADQTEAQVQQ